MNRGAFQVEPLEPLKIPQVCEAGVADLLKTGGKVIAGAGHSTPIRDIARLVAQYGGKHQAQEVLSQSSFYSANDLRLHFGLGTARTVDLEIRWPSGLKQSFKSVAPNRIITIREGRGLEGTVK